MLLLQWKGLCNTCFSFILMEKALKFHRPLYTCFIDLRKGYDSISHEALWSILQSSYHPTAELISIIWVGGRWIKSCCESVWEGI